MKKVTIIGLLVLLPGISWASTPLDKLLVGMLPASASAKISSKMNLGSVAPKFNVVLKEQQATRTIQQNALGKGAARVVGVNKIQCPRCMCEYDSVESMELHNRRHKEIDRNKKQNRMRCSEAGCTELFRDKTGREHHVAFVHGHIGNAFQCNCCTASYPSQEHLNNHLLWHSRNSFNAAQALAAFGETFKVAVAAAQAPVISPETEIEQNAGKRAHNNSAIPGQPPAKKQKAAIEDVAQALPMPAPAAAAASSNAALEGQKTAQEAHGNNSQNDIDCVVEKEKISCPECVNSFNSKVNFSKHLKTHNKRRDNKDPYNIRCSEDPNCSQRFTDLHGERSHALCHRPADNAQAPHKCTYCTASFASSSSLKKHLTWHPRNSLNAASARAAATLLTHSNSGALAADKTENEQNVSVAPARTSVAAAATAASPSGAISNAVSKVLPARANALQRISLQDPRLIEYVCGQNGCSEYFHNKTSLKCHKTLHGRVTNFRCEECDLGYKGEAHLDRHCKIFHANTAHKGAAAGDAAPLTDVLSKQDTQKSKDSGHVLSGQPGTGSQNASAQDVNAGLARASAAAASCDNSQLLAPRAMKAAAAAIYAPAPQTSR